MTIIDAPSYRSLYLEAFHGTRSLGAGTGFFVQEDHKRYLITNWHVLSGRNPEDGAIRYKEHPLVPDRVRVRYHHQFLTGNFVEHWYSLFDDRGPKWLVHPHFRHEVDVVALEIPIRDGIRFDPYRIENIPSPVLIRPTTAVSVVGFPFTLSVGPGLAVWTHGFVASEPEIDYQNLPMFLIDSRTREGQSGSPVIFASDGLVRHADQSLSMGAGGLTIQFLGVYSGRVNEKSDIGRVWKREALLEILRGEMRDQLHKSWPGGTSAHLDGTLNRHAKPII